MGTGQVIAATGTGVAVAGAAGYAMLERAGMPSDEEIDRVISPAADAPSPSIVMQGTGIARGWAYRQTHPLYPASVSTDRVMHSLANDDRVHAGLDIVGPIGTPVFAARTGVVIHAQPRRGYGNVVLLKHRGGVTTLYAHLHTIAVRRGQVMGAGQMIGTLGRTSDARGGTSHFPNMGPHVHFSVHRRLPQARPSSARERRYGTEPLRWLGRQGSRAIFG